MTSTKPQLTPYQLHLVATRATCDRRSLKRYLDGEPVRILLRARIEAALREYGLTEFVREERAS